MSLHACIALDLHAYAHTHTHTHITRAVFIYHLYLVYLNQTTNETQKYGGINSYYSDREKKLRKLRARAEKAGESLPDEDAENRPVDGLFNPATAPALDERPASGFPASKNDLPLDFYRHASFMANLREVLFPRSLYPPRVKRQITPDRQVGQNGEHASQGSGGAGSTTNRRKSKKKKAA